MNVAWCDYYVIFKVENVDNRLTAALLSAGLSNFVRSDTSSSSRTESPDIIPGKDSPKSFASSDDLDSSISVKTNAVWETTEQRMNTKAPVSRQTSLSTVTLNVTRFRDFQKSVKLE